MASGRPPCTTRSRCRLPTAMPMARCPPGVTAAPSCAGAGLEPDRLLVLQPTRALPRKTVAGGIGAARCSARPAGRCGPAGKTGTDPSSNARRRRALSGADGATGRDRGRDDHRRRRPRPARCRDAVDLGGLQSGPRTVASTATPAAAPGTRWRRSGPRPSSRSSPAGPGLRPRGLARGTRPQLRRRTWPSATMPGSARRRAPEPDRWFLPTTDGGHRP